MKKLKYIEGQELFELTVKDDEEIWGEYLAYCLAYKLIHLDNFYYELDRRRIPRIETGWGIIYWQ